MVPCHGSPFERMHTAQGHNINWFESNVSKMADKSTSTRPWSSICKLNETLRSSMTVPSHHQKTKKWAVANSWKSLPLFQNSWNNLPTHQPMKLPSPYTLTTPHFEAAALTLCDGPPSVCGVCFSLNESTSYLSLCLSLDSFWDETSRAWASWGPETNQVTHLSWKTVVLSGFESQPHGL